MQLDAIKACSARPSRRIGKNFRQHSREFANVRQVRVSYSLAITKAKRLKLALIKDPFEQFGGRVFQKRTHGLLGCLQPAFVVSHLQQRITVVVSHLQKASKELRRIGPLFDSKEINDLNE